MIISKETLKTIKGIIDNHYNTFTLSVLGKDVFTPEQLEKFKIRGIDIDNPKSWLDMVYNYNFLNDIKDSNKPQSVASMMAQQAQPGVIPEGEAHAAALEHLNESAKISLDKLKADWQARVEGIIRDSNNDYRFDALQNLDREDRLDSYIKANSIGKIKTELRDATKDGNRNWHRVATTETSNAIGIGSTDRIVSQNRKTPPDEIYVYRIVVEDAALCKYCRRFYQDSDDTPKVYKLSTLLANGSNYGRKAYEWRPVTTATHPNERCSQVIQLRPGWKVMPGGSVKFIGLDAWKDYIVDKLEE